MSFWTGKRLLINLHTGRSEDPGRFVRDLTAEERRQVELTLAEYAKLISKKEGGFSSERLHGAVLLAARHEMKQVRTYLETIEQHAWHGPSSFGPTADWGYGKGLGDQLRKEGYQINEGRRFAQLALRRLGFRPKGYSQYSFEEAKKNVAIPPEERKRRSSQITIGWLSMQVYGLLGAPDDMMTAVEDDDTKGYAYLKKKWVNAWRYDFDPPDDFSLIVIWDDQGRVRRIEKITPALWRGDHLFSDKVPKPVFRADGTVNGIHLYSPHFLGKISVVERERPVKGVTP